MKYLNVLLGFIYIVHFSNNNQNVLSFRFYKNGDLSASISTPFCLGETCSKTGKCSYCMTRATHVYTKFDKNAPRLWESPAALWRTWQNKHAKQYNKLWQIAMNNFQNGNESIYQQINRLRRTLLQYE